MTWNDLILNWAESYRALRKEFPGLEPSAMPFVKADRARFEAYLAATHDMTVQEARDMFEAYLNRKVKELQTA